MTNFIEKQISDRYFKDYLKAARQGPGLWAKITRNKEVGLIATGICSTAVVPTMMVSLFAPALIPAAMASNLSVAFLGTAATIVAPIATALVKTSRQARKNFTADLENGPLVDRFKNDLIAEEKCKLSTAQQLLPALEQVSNLADFQKVAAKRAEIVQDLTAQRTATVSAPKTQNR